MSQVSWLEFNVPFQHKYGYIRDEKNEPKAALNAALQPPLAGPRAYQL